MLYVYRFRMLEKRPSVGFDYQGMWITNVNMLLRQLEQEYAHGAGEHLWIQAVGPTNQIVGVAYETVRKALNAKEHHPMFVYQYLQQVSQTVPISG